MFGLTKPKLPITADEQKSVDNCFSRLATLLGAHRLLDATVMLPTPDHFPDPYDGSEPALQRIFHRVATHMNVSPAEIQLTLFKTGYGMTRDIVPLFSGEGSGASGLYHHDPAASPHISIDEALLKEPNALVATLAHELGHIILLRPGLVDPDDPDMEPLNDLLTVFMGLGVFTANSAFRFEQHSDYASQGWSVRRSGYLSEQLFGYALARFAFERGEPKPAWSRFLATNVAVYLKRSAAWSTTRPEPRLFAKA